MEKIVSKNTKEPVDAVCHTCGSLLIKGAIERGANNSSLKTIQTCL